MFEFSLHSWKRDVIGSLFEETSANAICQLSPLTLDKSDSLIWCHKPRGMFTMKSAFLFLKASSRPPMILEEQDWRAL